MIYFSADTHHESPEKDETDSGEDTDDMRRDEDDDLGFSDLCKYIEKCVARKYKVDKSEAYKVSFQYNSLFIMIMGIFAPKHSTLFLQSITFSPPA